MGSKRRTSFQNSPGCLFPLLHAFRFFAVLFVPPQLSRPVLPPVLPTCSVTEEVTAAASCIQVQAPGLETIREEQRSLVDGQPRLSPSEAEEHFAIFANHYIEPDSTTDIPEPTALSCGHIQTEEIVVLTSSGETRDGFLSLTCSQPPAWHLPHDTNFTSHSVEDISPTCTRVSVIVKAPARKTEDNVYASTDDSTKSVGSATESSVAALSAVFAQQCQEQVQVMEKKPVNSWTVADLESYLYMRGYERVALTMRKLHIDGQRLLNMLEWATNVRQQLGLLYADGSKFFCLIRQLQSLRDDAFMSNTDLEPL
ncbi:hypothetical protein RvY_18797-1 [Ramazzottius varieornatus]|uniref:SAM domain-containing protein n=1 Tax=Ramazzottius varieornatus TaxID=947166 RepID=A0A1D1W745_RAMVA|nr:hypothetical protein RvY_18797-1 [Ramazzottius varieornatus]